MKKLCIWNFKPVIKKQQLPKTWDEFCEMMFFAKKEEHYIDSVSNIERVSSGRRRYVDLDKNLLPDRDTAEAVLALCQLIQLRNAYNGNWAPDWTDYDEDKYVIEFSEGKVDDYQRQILSSSPLYFKSKELLDEFLCNFRPLIEKLKPLYGIK